MSITKLKTAFIVTSFLFSASAFSQSLHCNGDARILSSDGQGTIGAITASANGNHSQHGAGSQSSSADDSNVDSASDATVEIYDGLDRYSCFGTISARLTDFNTGALVQSVDISVSDSLCKITLQGQVNMMEERPVDGNGNCSLENRGRQVHYDNRSYAISGFVYRNVQ